MPRSGSTFVGGLFKHNAEMVYLFEATRSIGEAHERDGCSEIPEKWEENIILETFRCNFHPLEKHLNNRSIVESELGNPMGNYFSIFSANVELEIL
jgi:hypothetical protein